ncbi:MAG: SIS domain-containing protein [Rhodobacter sp.]|nr:SIS domain-containing protein [Rhodobacter sp.]
MKDSYLNACAEIAAVADALDLAQVETACRLIGNSGKIVLFGCGREGLQVQGLAMRLHHLGLDATMQGAMNTPPLGPGDLFLTSAGPGELSTVTALMQTAKGAGADILFLTARPDTPSAALADHILSVPAQTMATDRSAPSSTLPMGSLYEGALFVLFEVMVRRLAVLLAETPETMRARHTNME